MYYIGSIPFGYADLAHSGRLGMKWGQHIFGKEEDRIKARAYEKAKEMSDDDLRKESSRLKLENDYVAALSTKYSNTKSKGKEFIVKLLEDALYGYITSYAKNLGQKTVNEKPINENKKQKK